MPLPLVRLQHSPVDLGRKSGICPFARVYDSAAYRHRPHDGLTREPLGHSHFAVLTTARSWSCSAVMSARVPSSGCGASSWATAVRTTADTGRPRFAAAVGGRRGGDRVAGPVQLVPIECVTNVWHLHASMRASHGTAVAPDSGKTTALGDKSGIHRLRRLRQRTEGAGAAPVGHRMLGIDVPARRSS